MIQTEVNIVSNVLNRPTAEDDIVDNHMVKWGQTAKPMHALRSTCIRNLHVVSTIGIFNTF